MLDLIVEGISKKYTIREHDEPWVPSTKWLSRVRGTHSESRDIWALRNVSFEVRRGEALGIVGHNGAGKSTILKLLSSITTPTAGEIVVRGRLAPLIEVSSGFHPDLSGRENIHLNGSILGMSRAEISRKMERIIEFSGIRQFIDVPVKRYSTGMYLRLGFAIAAHLEPDILLLDEVLAVGDAAFQEKCHARIAELREAGVTMVLISHDLRAVLKLCDRALLLERGRIVGVGSPAEIVSEYQKRSIPVLGPGPQETSRQSIDCTSLTFHPADGNPGNVPT